jgi:hypothetical protein
MDLYFKYTLLNGLRSKSGEAAILLNPRMNRQ